MTRALRISAFLFPVPLLWWASTDPRFRNDEGLIATPFCLALACAIACVPLYWASRPKWRNLCLWLSLALVGQAVALQIIDAGNLIRYQHYRGWEKLFVETNPLLPGFLLVQTLCILCGIGRRRKVIWACLRRVFRPWQLAAVAVVFSLTAAAVSRDVSFFVSELSFAALLQTVNLANLILVAWAVPEEALPKWKRWIDGAVSEGHGGGSRVAWSVDRFVLAAAIWVIACSSLLNVTSYQRMPHLADEVTYLYQGRYFAQGRLSMPAPPVAEAFDLDLMTFETDRWYAPTAPGWPLLLSLGVWVGVPWLVNPLLGGINVILAFVLVRALYHERIARLVVLLLAVSPWNLFMAMSFMPHTSTLTFALVAAVGVVRARETGRSVWGWIGGLGIGYCSLIRPLDGVILALLLGLWAAGWGGQRLKALALTGLVLCAVAGGAIQLSYNAKMTGDPMVFPIQAYTDRHYGPGTNALGFGPNRGLGWPLDPYPGHGWRDVVVNTHLNSFSVNVELLGWAAGSLLFPVVAVLSGAKSRGDRGMLLALIVLIAGYSLVWYSGGPDFGARYWFLGLVPLLALTARGAEWLGRQLEQHAGMPTGWGRTRVLTAVFAACTIAVVNYIPWRAVDKYFHYLRMRPDVADLERRHDFGKSLILVHGERFPDYSAAAVFNPMDHGSPRPLYVWDRGHEVRDRLVKAYPDRSVWTVNGPTITGAGFEVAQRPPPRGRN